MDMKVIYLLLAGILMSCCVACSNEVDFGEQYKKQVYIVNGNNRYTETTLMMAESVDGFVTFYCSGSDWSSKDVQVNYKVDREALDHFNTTEFENDSVRIWHCIPEEYITFHEPMVTIKAGEEYAPLHFSVNTSGLDPSLVYAIPLTITEVSDYEINPDVKSLLYKVDLQTEYSGTYNARVDLHYYGRLESTKFAQKLTTAVSKKEIKVPVLDNKEVVTGSNKYYIITLNDDNSLTLSSGDPLFTSRDQIMVGGVPVKTNYYDPETKQFVVGYSYVMDPSDSWSARYIIETLTHAEE